VTFGFPSNEPLNGGSFRKEDIDDFEVKNIENQNQESISSSQSLEERLIPEGVGGLGLIAVNSYYGGRKTISQENHFLTYLFFPHLQLNFTSKPDSPRNIFYGASELQGIIPYIRSYVTGFSSQVYAFEQEYSPLEKTQKQLQYEGIGSLHYKISTQLYNPKFFSFGERPTIYVAQPESHKFLDESKPTPFIFPELKIISVISD